MKKRLLAAAIAMLSTSTANANPILDRGWSLSSNFVPRASGVDIFGDYYGIDAVLYRTVKEGAGIGFIFDDKADACFGATNRFESDSVRVNGTLVKMFVECISADKTLLSPRTVKGTNFIIHQFKRSNFVEVTIWGGEITYSAKGFTKLYNQFNNERAGI